MQSLACIAREDGSATNYWRCPRCGLVREVAGAILAPFARSPVWQGARVFTE